MERIQFILWSVVVGYLIIRVLFRLNLLGSFAAGLACLGGAASLLAPSLDGHYWAKEGYDGIFSNHWVELHASVAIFSYGIFGLLAVVSVMYLIQQNALRTKQSGTLAPFLPSIHQLETAGARLLLIGSVFLTGSIVVGSLDWTRSPESLSAAKVGLTVALRIAYCHLNLRMQTATPKAGEEQLPSSTGLTPLCKSTKMKRVRTRAFPNGSRDLSKMVFFLRKLVSSYALKNNLSVPNL